MKKKAIVLLSAGLDSTVNLFLASRDPQLDVVLTLTFNYGQKAAQQEMNCAKQISEFLKIKNKVIDLPWLKDLGQSSLTKEAQSIPEGKQISIDDLETSLRSAKSVWVPNRNGVFLNVAASFAEAYGAQVLIPGFNAEEAATFPDNSFNFIRSLRKSFLLSTANGVDVQCYTIRMSKTEIVKAGQDLRIPFQLIWPCYQNYEKWCGVCESCQRAKRAFKAHHVDILGQFIK